MLKTLIGMDDTFKLFYNLYRYLNTVKSSMRNKRKLCRKRVTRYQKSKSCLIWEVKPGSSEFTHPTLWSMSSIWYFKQHSSRIWIHFSASVISSVAAPYSSPRIHCTRFSFLASCCFSSFMFNLLWPANEVKLAPRQLCASKHSCQAVWDSDDSQTLHAMINRRLNEDILLRL